MTVDRTLAIAGRLIHQLLHDHRTIGLVIGAPVIVMALVGFSFSNHGDTLNRIAPALIGTFTLFFTFLLTGISFLRERTQGTLERMLATPVGRGDILFGYLLGFIPFATGSSYHHPCIYNTSLASGLPGGSMARRSRPPSPSNCRGKFRNIYINFCKE